MQDLLNSIAKRGVRLEIVPFNEGKLLSFRFSHPNVDMSKTCVINYDTVNIDYETVCIELEKTFKVFLRYL